MPWWREKRHGNGSHISKSHTPGMSVTGGLVLDPRLREQVHTVDDLDDLLHP